MAKITAAGLVVTAISFILWAFRAAVASPSTRPAVPAEVQVDVHVGEAVPDGSNVCPIEKGFALYHAYGTEVHIQLARPAGDILAVDNEASRLERAVDDTGTDLMAVLEKDRPKNWPSHYETAPPGQHDRTEGALWLPGVPAKNAKNVTVEATAVLLCGSSLKTTSPIPIDVTGVSGTAVHAGDLHLSVIVNRFEENRMDIRVSAEHGVERVEEVQLFDGDNHRVVCHRGGCGTQNDNLESADWILEGAAPMSLLVVIVYFDEVRRVSVPVHSIVYLKPFPTGPMTAQISSGPLTLNLELEYDRVALKDAGLTASGVTRQVERYLNAADEVSVGDLKLIEIRTADGEKTFLGTLVNSIDIRLQRRPPPS